MLFLIRKFNSDRERSVFSIVLREAQRYDI